MVQKQSFDEFLNSPGPSNLAGRGRGCGGRGGFSRGGGGGGGRSSFRTDYSAVPLDYSKINKKGYTKLDGYDVAPHGPESRSAAPSGGSTPRGSGRGGGRGTGRGRGRGGLGYTLPRDPPSGPASGTSTPVTGLGFHGRGHTFQQGGRVGPKSRAGDTVGKEGVTWGGGAAPLFVKAGELFKEGEVDVITVDKDNHVHVEVEPLSDPSAPQMEDLKDDTEIDVVRPDLLAELSAREIVQWSPSSQSHHGTAHDEEDDDSSSQLSYASEVSDIAQAEAVHETITAHLESTLVIGDHASESSGEAEEADPQAPISTSKHSEQFEEDSKLDSAEKTDESQEEDDSEPDAIPDDSLFFVDTEPTDHPGSQREIVYESTTVLLGDAPQEVEEEEEIVLQPRKFAKPKPIAVDLPSESPGVPTVLGDFVSRSFVSPPSLTRKQKKALKKAKRARNKSKKGKNRRNTARKQHGSDGSDLDWGSDGPPSHILGVDGVDEESDAERDKEILRDYLKGTLLGVSADQAEDDGDSESESDTEAITREYDAAVETGDGDEFVLDSDEEDNPDIEENSDEEEDAKDDGSESDSSTSSHMPTAIDIDSQEEDEVSEEDLDKLFSGKDSWVETEWFIRNLEGTLDDGVDAGPSKPKGRKSRQALFSAIEDGDFGDDWDLTVPAPKKNKKKSTLPPELQGQWEKDRQKKAERKRQRDLERVLNLVDPYPATHGKKGKGKGKSKGSSRIEQAKMAHLIPQSASQIADLFDVPSDDDFGSSSRMSTMANLLLPGTRGFAAIDLGVRQFLEDEGKTTFSVPPMNKEGRMKVHLLADCYGLKSKSIGQGKDRFTTLIKTSRSGVFVNAEKAARLVAASSLSGKAFNRALYSNSRKDKKDKKGAGDRGNSARARDGELVGEGAERIGEDNIGHRLLSKMGWAEGSSIGRFEGGLDNPIVAVVKNTKMGLGAYGS